MIFRVLISCLYLVLFIGSLLCYMDGKVTLKPYLMVAITLGGAAGVIVSLAWCAGGFQ